DLQWKLTSFTAHGPFALTLTKDAMRKSTCLLPLGLRVTSQFALGQIYEIQGCVSSVGAGCKTPRILTASKSFLRSFLSTSGEDVASDDDFREKLRTIARVVQVQQDLKHELEFHDSISAEKLLQLILDRGAARDEHEAQELIRSMQRAGVMLVHNKHVFLKPSDLVEHCFPDSFKADDVKAKLDEIERKLKPYEEIHRTAEKKAWGLLYVGCLVIALQLATFLRLTYYELSWDVMEPIGYIISLVYTLLGYFFFIYTKGHPFDLQPVKEWYARRLKEQRTASSDSFELDDEQYEALAKARDRYLKRFHFLQKLESKHTTEGT
ncbi:hypothetical protein Vretifemale_17016, partial [Volvox reticuliferus]